MRKQITELLAAILLLVGAVGLSINSHACTAIRLVAIDSSVVVGRTMEWGAFYLKSEICIVPQKYPFIAQTSNPTISGKSFASIYGFIGINSSSINKDILIGGCSIMKDACAFSEGMNERGLVVNSNYDMNAEYQDFDSLDASNTITLNEVTGYILSQFKSVAEVKSGIRAVNVVDYYKTLGIPLRFKNHWMVTDSTGRSIVIEYINKELVIKENPLGVMTNEPSFQWHLVNLGNYLNIPYKLMVDSCFYRTVPGVYPLQSIQVNGSGYNFCGLPGDNTPPSRFIRAVVWTQTARPCKDGKDAMSEAFRILDNFQLPSVDGIGVVGSSVYIEGADIFLAPNNHVVLKPNIDGSTQMQIGSDNEYAVIDSTHLKSDTQWTIVSDTKNKILYYHTQFNRRIRSMDLNKIDFTDTKILPIEMELKTDPSQDIIDVTP